MRRNYLENKRISENSIRAISFGCFPVFIICAVIFLIGLISSYEEESNAAIIFLSGAIIFLIITFIYFTKSSTKLDSVEKNILKIIIAYLKEFKVEQTEVYNIIPKIFIYHKHILLKEFINKYYNQNINLTAACRNLARESNNAKYFLIYMILDFTAEDDILSIKEESLLKEIYINLFISSSVFNLIKNTYIKQGLKEERKIIEDQKRKEAAEKLSKSFIPYNAYKILGVSPTVTKAQLKKVYRTLAKKYHPDKFYGQSEEVIQEVEEKFQEVTEAYEIITVHKNY